MADRVGQRLGNYYLDRLLGRGNFADVYLGTHNNLPAQVTPLVGREQDVANACALLPTGCATSFTSTAIRFESMLHRFSVREKEKMSLPLSVDKRAC